ncbi:Uncharacterized conserved protein YeaO, DUF488 family [[Clostridium] aminophilum]|uniref:Uncharacterized conserved protein YeaO, DUF488 family n=1 Tax=[Clostridium] aminophilum TaxID=1526 RepID=A0A1I0A8I4_9FIRM|nr:DUF488 family protein [[Clostridium] aminophilum]SES90483.1 Uncharacterized conserved protein YeaO, DUF488 family [[Clostridium] aminophilum]
MNSQAVMSAGEGSGAKTVMSRPSVMNHEIRIMRVYEVTPEMEGYRILVDRLWPRGLKKERITPFDWAQTAAPSKALRKWFSHDPQRFAAFAERYREELNFNRNMPELAEKIKEILADQDVFLLYSAKNREENQAVILKEWLERMVRTK